MKTESAAFSMPIRLVSLANVREHWAKRASRAKLQRSHVKFFCPQFDLPCVVTITRVAPRKLDDDNLVSSAKNLRDGIADKLGIDDRDERVAWRYEQRKGKPREYAVDVLIERPDVYEQRVTIQSCRDGIFIRNYGSTMRRVIDDITALK